MTSEPRYVVSLPCFLGWGSLGHDIRLIIPGFSDFLQPKKFVTLSTAARCGPVVVINIHNSRCDTLVVIADPGGVIRVPLDSSSCDQAQDPQRSLNRLLSTAGVRMRTLADLEWYPLNLVTVDLQREFGTNGGGVQLDPLHFFPSTRLGSTIQATLDPK